MLQVDGPGIDEHDGSGIDGHDGPEVGGMWSISGSKFQARLSLLCQSLFPILSFLGFKASSHFMETLGRSN